MGTKQGKGSGNPFLNESLTTPPVDANVQALADQRESAIGHTKRSNRVSAPSEANAGENSLAIATIIVNAIPGLSAKDIPLMLHGMQNTVQLTGETLATVSDMLADAGYFLKRDFERTHKNGTRSVVVFKLTLDQLTEALPVAERQAREKSAQFPFESVKTIETVYTYADGVNPINRLERLIWNGTDKTGSFVINGITFPIVVSTMGTEFPDRFDENGIYKAKRVRKDETGNILPSSTTPERECYIVTVGYQNGDAIERITFRDMGVQNLDAKLNTRQAFPVVAIE